jgi:predicted nucleic acid-binding protein
MYLLDTTVISELRKANRNTHVVDWIEKLGDEELYLSVITVAEIAKGIARQRRVGTPDAISQADALQTWLEGLLAAHSGRIVPVDIPIATRWGRLCVQHPQYPTDMLLAATALDQYLTVATRNVERFRPTGVDVVNPFAAPR